MTSYFSCPRPLQSAWAVAASALQCEYSTAAATALRTFPAHVSRLCSLDFSLCAVTVPAGPLLCCTAVHRAASFLAFLISFFVWLPRPCEHCLISARLPCCFRGEGGERHSVGEVGGRGTSLINQPALEIYLINVSLQRRARRQLAHPSAYTNTNPRGRPTDGRGKHPSFPPSFCSLLY